MTPSALRCCVSALTPLNMSRELFVLWEIKAEDGWRSGLGLSSLEVLHKHAAINVNTFDGQSAAGTECV